MLLGRGHTGLLSICARIVRLHRWTQSAMGQVPSDCSGGRDLILLRIRRDNPKDESAARRCDDGTEGNPPRILAIVGASAGPTSVLTRDGTAPSGLRRRRPSRATSTLAPSWRLLGSTASTALETVSRLRAPSLTSASNRDYPGQARAQIAPIGPLR
jgi:hypothetical protein